MLTLAKNFIFFFVFLSFVQIAQAANHGSIYGKVVDAETGDPIVGANIFLENTTLGAASDVDGHFAILQVPSGSYTLVVSVVGYVEYRIKNITVQANQSSEVNAAIQSEILTTEVVEVEERALQNTEASMLKDRQKALVLSDAISAEAIAEAGSQNAAEALRQITGVSVVDGKYFVVRGLGDRYTSAQLNGAELPSNNPYRKTASLDLIPGALIDNIVTIKSFTPDRPGDFSGGAVNVKTRDFPDRLQMNAGISFSYNSQVNLRNLPGFNVGKYEWLGINDGTLSLPTILKSKTMTIPDIGKANKDGTAAQELIKITKSFNPQLAPVQSYTPLNRSFSFSLGNQIRVFGRPLGFLAGFSYNRSFSGYENGLFQRWNQAAQGVISSVFDLQEQKATQEILWGGLFKLSYRFNPDHNVSLNWIYNKNTEITARRLQGKYPYDMDDNTLFMASVLNFSERTLVDGQFRSEHFLPNLKNLRIDWILSAGNSKEAQPDQRYFNSYYDKRKKVFGIKDNTPPSRYFRDLNENKFQFAFNLKLPFRQWEGFKGFFKTGAYYLKRDRTYNERLFQLVDHQGFKFDGDPNALLSEENIGILDTLITTIRGVEYRSYDWGVVVQESRLPANNYTADQNVRAYYLMMELPLTRSVRLIGGARLEKTDMSLVTSDSTLKAGKIKTNDVLPSVNLVWNIAQNMNLRMAFNRTLARPTFREIGPFATFDFMGGDVYVGNPELRRTLINNYDLRWEWFSKPGEIIATSLFFKTFRNPIERVFNTFEENTWKNVDDARAFGFEFEIRKHLNLIHHSLNHLLIGANLSLIRSQVQISEEELQLIRNLRPGASGQRPFQGQSPYLVNLNLTYNHPELGITSTLYFNILGPRLSKVSYGGTPDVYEAPAGLLNFTFAFRLWKNFSVKLSAKNLLNPTFQKYQELNHQRYLYSQYKLGRSISVGVSFSY